MTPKERKINYFVLYSLVAAQPFFFFDLLLYFLSHNLLVHLIGVSRSARQKWGRKREAERGWKKGGGVWKQTDRARQRQSIWLPKKVRGRQTVGAKPWRGAEARRLPTRPRWMQAGRWSSVIIHCSRRRHLSDKWGAECWLGLLQSGAQDGGACDSTREPKLQLPLGNSDVKSSQRSRCWQRSVSLVRSLQALHLHERNR